MRRKFAPLMLAFALSIALVSKGGPAAGSTKATYYVSLGDSAAAGLQPNGYTTTQGYADQLFRLVRSEFTQLRLLKLGCSGETTDGLITGAGSFCTYQSGSQLDEAINFLQTHPGQVEFITIDIGANDVLFGCWDPDTGVLDGTCVQGELPAIETNVSYIVRALQVAAPGVPIAGMNYWGIFLGYWVTGPDGQTLAQTDEQSIEPLNAALLSAYEDEGVLAANVAGPDYFNSADFTDMVVTKEWGEVPLNVANECEWTWFCAKPPHGPDVHPNTEGYGVIADAFAAVLPG
jgi:lysophospholipase L1-like esterase